MMSLLVFKERLKEFYGRFNIYIIPVIRFVFSFLTFELMNRNIGFMPALMNPLAPLLLALICSFLPFSAISFIAGAFMLAHLWAVSFEITVVMALFMLAVALLYYSFHPKDSYLLILTPLFFALDIPYAIPLLVGLSGTMISVIPIGCGVFIYYALLYVKQNAGVLTNEISSDAVHHFSQIAKSLFGNNLMLVMIAAFTAALIVVCVIKKLSFDYSWIIAIVAGTITQLVVIFIGDIIGEISIPVTGLLAGIVISLLLAGIYTFFVFTVDYSRTEYVQFEDDDYYYYVKAVPKMTVSTPDVKVQKINARKLQRPLR